MNFRALCLAATLILASAPTSPAQGDDNETMELPPVKEHIQLTRGDMIIRLYQPLNPPTRAIIVLGSGDGGWTPWEDAVAGWLRSSGICVAGVDLREYAESDYDQKTLSRDMASIAKLAATRMQLPSLPIIYGGWSMGATQAVAAASGPEAPSELVGLLLMSADHRGRYGLRQSDELGITPEGPGTFSLTEFNKDMARLRVAQFHGSADFMASTAWIQTLKSRHTLYIIPGANHGFGGPDDGFREWLNEGVNWVLGDDSAAAKPPQRDSWFSDYPLWLGTIAAISLSLFFAFSRRHSLKTLVTATLIMGLMNLLEAFLKKPPVLMSTLQKWVPLGLADNNQLPLFLSGLFLLAIARGLSRRKRVAWWVTVAMLAISILLHILRSFDWHHMVAAAVLLVPLVRWRREFFAKSDASSLRWAILWAMLIVLGLLTFGTIRIHQYSERGEFGEPLSWSDCMQGALNALTLQHTQLDEDGSRSARNVLQNLRDGSLLGGLLLLGIILRPVIESRQLTASGNQRERTRHLIDQYGTDPMNAFALMEDKRYYFHPNKPGVVPYALWRNFAVVLADPICDPAHTLTLVKGFTHFCKGQDWVPLFYCSHASFREMYENLNFITLKIGEDARLRIEEFNLQGGKYQNLRTAINRARRENASFVWYDASQGIDYGIEAQLRLLSDEWLNAKHGGEMTFDLGSFDIDFIRTHGAALVTNEEGRVQAFATWHSFAQGKGRTLDLMRCHAEARNGGLMDFLILESIYRFKEMGVEEISLGNAPLANVRYGSDGKLSRGERATRFIFENFDHFYGYKSLYSFKKKYQPEWHGRYLVYPVGVGLPMVGLAVAGVHLPRGFRALLKS